jgi:hypothetical protein
MFEHLNYDLGYADLESETLETGRHYQTPDGKKYPSITTCLSILSEKGIAAWRKRVGDVEADKISFRASTRGTAVHEIIEDYINNVPNYTKKYMPNIVANFLDVKEILDTRIGKVYAQEVPLYSHHLGVAGRVDCVAEYKKAKLRKYVEAYFMQESFYAIAWEEITGLPITQLVTIIAVDNDEPQVFIEHRDNWSGPLQDTIKKYKDRKNDEQYSF